MNPSPIANIRPSGHHIVAFDPETGHDIRAIAFCEHWRTAEQLAGLRADLDVALKLLEEAGNCLNTNVNEERDLYARIRETIRATSTGNPMVFDLAEDMASAYETGESRDMYAATHLYRRMFPKRSTQPTTTA